MNKILQMLTASYPVMYKIELHQLKVFDNDFFKITKVIF